MNKDGHGKENQRKGSISVLMMILLSSMIIVFLLLYHDASLRTLQSVVRWNGENAGNTVLTYYLPELKDRYDLFGLWKESSLLEWRMKGYVENSSPFWRRAHGTSLLNAECEQIQVDAEEYLLMDPRLIQGQIHDVMEQGMIVDLIQRSDLISQWKDVLTWVGKGLELQEEQGELSVQRSQDRTAEETQDPTEENYEQLEQDVRQMESQGRSAMKEITLENGRTLEDPMVIAYLPSRQVTSSGIQTSWEILKTDPEKLGEFIGKSLLTDLYALHYFSSYTERQDGWFVCQLEYILQGRLSDEENLERTKTELFLLRTGLNLVSVYQNNELRQFVGTMAAAAAPIPYPVAFGVLAAAISAMEAGEDVKTLMGGETVSPLKTYEDWLTMSEHQNAQDVPRMEQEKQRLEMTYEDHLHLLLILKPQETKILRMMDLIQLDLQKSFGDTFTLEELCGGFRWKLQSLMKTSRGEEQRWICEGISQYGS
ncbi:MAG: hypothetical protein IKD13_05025 [Firmicutes bacterium]|nr:hypothetical protein [Bacillota bacterium]